MAITVAQITETDSHGGDVVIRASSGDEKIEIALSPQDVLSLISALMRSRGEALKEQEPREFFPATVHEFVILKGQRGEEYLRLYLTPLIYHDYEIPALGQPAEALANWSARISGKGQGRS